MKDRFEYQRPTAEQVAYIEIVREMCRLMWQNLKDTPMDPRCRALAITKLEEVSMWANKGIVFYEPEEDSPGV